MCLSLYSSVGPSVPFAILSHYFSINIIVSIPSASMVPVVPESSFLSLSSAPGASEVPRCSGFWILYSAEAVFHDGVYKL